MLANWSILLVSFGYLGLLFAIAYYADRRADTVPDQRAYFAQSGIV